MKTAALVAAACLASLSLGQALPKVGKTAIYDLKGRHVIGAAFIEVKSTPLLWGVAGHLWTLGGFDFAASSFTGGLAAVGSYKAVYGGAALLYTASKPTSIGLVAGLTGRF